MIIKQPSRAFPPNNYISGIFFKLALSDRSPHNSIIFIDCFQKLPEIAFMSAINNNFVQSIIKFSLPNYLPKPFGFLSTQPWSIFYSNYNGKKSKNIIELLFQLMI